MLTRFLRRQGGFTLIELLAVIAIMTVLAGVVAGAVTGIGASGQSARLQGDADTLGKAADRFFNDAFPQSYPVLSCCKFVGDAASTTTANADATPGDILTAGDLGVRLIDFEAVLPGDPKRAFVPDFLKEVPATAGLVSWRIVTATGETFFAEDGAQLVRPSNNRLDVSATTTTASTTSAAQTSDYTYKLRMKKDEAALEVLKFEIPAGYGIGGQSLAPSTVVGTFNGQFATDNPWLPGQVIDYTGALTATGFSNEWLLAVNYRSTAKVNNVAVNGTGLGIRPDRTHKVSINTPSTETAGSITLTLAIPTTDKAQNEATETWTLVIYGKVGNFSGTPTDPKTMANVITNPTFKGVYRWLAKEQTSIDVAGTFDTVAGNQSVVVKAATVSATPTPTATPTPSPAVTVATSTDFTIGATTFTPTLGSTLARTTGAYYSYRITNTTANRIGDSSVGQGVNWRYTVLGPSGFNPQTHITLQEVGWKDATTFSLTPEVYTFVENVANGSSAWEVEANDTFTNVDSVSFTAAAPLGAYTITRVLIKGGGAVSNTLTLTFTLTQ